MTPDLLNSIRDPTDSLRVPAILIMFILISDSPLAKIILFSQIFIMLMEIWFDSQSMLTKPACGKVIYLE